ncbi:MAG: MmgE/PrpD family protein [Dehalococcoidia bacterium]|jgi:2-methylcitrate dehydratase PrpD|nr:MmgE/PrpD family protein [Dehalococcoidia bacterium]HJN87935.1 MmgE/PrpD family protein [Dehalococcoidia bacterium]
MELGETLAQYVADVKLSAVSPSEAKAAKAAILDQVGVAFAGIGEAPERILSGRLARNPAAEASILGRPQKTTTWLAALVNGTLGHSLDFDDTGGFGHPSVVILPAALATGEYLDCSGGMLLEAYVAAYEVGVALGQVVPRKADQLHGLHMTSVFGPLTSATASAKIMGLNSTRMRYAWGIAASQAGGIIGNFGTHAKPLHAGIASQAGVLAAELARDDFTANPNALDAPLGFFYSVVAAGDMDRVDYRTALKELGAGHIVSTWCLKKYPCGSIAQGAIDAALRLQGRAPLPMSELSSLEVRVPHLEPYFQVAPTGDVSGKFSYQFPVACALLDGRVTKWSFSDESFQRRELQDLLRKSAVAEDPDSRPHGVLTARWPAQEVVQPIEVATGDAGRPVALEEVRAKYLANVQPVLGADAAKETAEMLMALEEMPRIGALMDKLATRP